MRRWRELRKAQLAGEATVSPDPLAGTLANINSKPGTDAKHTKFLEFQTIVERIISEDTDNDWESIRRACPDCTNYGGSPWDHYVYHRSGSHSAGNTAGNSARTSEQSKSEGKGEEQ